MWANDQPPIATVASSAAAGASSITLTASTVPLMRNGRIVIGADNYRIAAVSGTQSGYQVTVSGVDAATGARVPVYYGGPSGAVAVEYLNISDDRHSTDATIYTGSGWTIKYDNIHDGNGSPGLGVAIGDGDRSLIEYNCLSKMGDYGLNIGGVDPIFEYNEIYDTNYNADPGCGCSGGGKWWGSLNADIVGNAFVDDGPGGSAPIWLDNGNAGTLIRGNYFYRDYGSSVLSETGYNLKITGNLFVDSGWGTGSGTCGSNCGGTVNLNTSGGLNVPGSRYENTVAVSGNQFINDWIGLDIWQSGQRSCEDSGEGGPGPGTDDAYCSGGFPNTELAASGGEYYFSHIGDSAHGGTTTVEQSAAAHSTRVLVHGAEAINDQIGFADPAHDDDHEQAGRQTFTGAAASISANTAGFPSAGELRVGTSAAWSNGLGSYTGAILGYTSTTASAFQGVTLVRGSGTLAGPVQQVQPYRVTAEKLLRQRLPADGIAAAGFGAGCGRHRDQRRDVPALRDERRAARPGRSPLTSVSYWDGCQWQARDISVTGNDFVFQPAVIAASAPLTGGTENNVHRGARG